MEPRGGVALAFGESLFIDADSWHRHCHLSAFAAFDRTLNNVPRLIPFGSQDSHRSFDVLRGIEDVDRKAFKENCEATSALGPGNVDLLHAMLRTRGTDAIRIVLNW